MGIHKGAAYKMINKEELLNQIYRLQRHKQERAFLDDFDTVSLNSVIRTIEESDTKAVETEEVDFEEVIYNVIHTMVSAKRGMDRALNEITDEEKKFVLQMLQSMREDE